MRTGQVFVPNTQKSYGALWKAQALNATMGKIRKYYYFGGQRVAMSESGVVTWLQGDHLGSASLATDSGGGVVSSVRYKPFGETRVETGAMPTNRKFDGMIEEAQAGDLYDFGARMYLPKIGRFVSADTIVPNPKDPQGLNRYSFTENNPVAFNDPTGHARCGDICYEGGGGWGLTTVGGVSLGLFLAAGYILKDGKLQNGSITIPAPLSPLPWEETKEEEKIGPIAPPLAKDIAKPLDRTKTDDEWVWVGYHGTSSEWVDSLADGVKQKEVNNFGGYSQLGPGFYTTTDIEAASFFAEAASQKIGNPVRLNVYARRSALAPPLVFNSASAAQAAKIKNPLALQLPPSVVAPIQGLPFANQRKFNIQVFMDLKVTP